MTREIYIIIFIVLTTTVFGQIFNVQYKDTIFYHKTECSRPDETYDKNRKPNHLADTCYLEKSLEKLIDGKYIVYYRNSNKVEKIITVKNHAFNGRQIYYRYAPIFTAVYDTYKKGKLIEKIMIDGDTLGKHTINYFSDLQDCYPFDDGHIRDYDYPNIPKPTQIIGYKNQTQVIMKGYYKKCLRHGKWEYWDDNGKLIQTEVYKMGELIKRINK